MAYPLPTFHCILSRHLLTHPLIHSNPPLSSRSLTRSLSLSPPPPPSSRGQTLPRPLPPTHRPFSSPPGRRPPRHPHTTQILRRARPATPAVCDSHRGRRDGGERCRQGPGAGPSPAREHGGDHCARRSRCTVC